MNLPRVTKIDDFAFDDTSRLRFFNAPRLLSIGRNALNDTHALEAVNLPRVEYVGINCFDLNGGLKVLRLPRLKVLDKNGLTGFASLTYVYAPSLATAWHDAITDNPRLEKVYAPKLSKLGPYAFGNNPNLRAIHLGEKPPTQEADVFAGDDPGKLKIYHRGDRAAWAGFVPAGNPKVQVLPSREGGAAPGLTAERRASCCQRIVMSMCGRRLRCRNGSGSFRRLGTCTAELRSVR